MLSVSAMEMEKTLRNSSWASPQFGLYISQTINISTRVRRIAGGSGYTASSIPDIDIFQAHTYWHICQHFNPWPPDCWRFQIYSIQYIRHIHYSILGRLNQWKTELNQPGSQPDSHKAKCQSVLKSLSTQSRNGIPAHANRQNGRQRYFWRNYRR